MKEITEYRSILNIASADFNKIFAVLLPPRESLREQRANSRT